MLNNRDHLANKKPVEFCSDMFLLPLGVPPIDSIDIGADIYLRNLADRPDPPPRTPLLPMFKLANCSNLLSLDQSYYDLLIDRLEFNNNAYVESVLSKSATAKISPAPSPPSRTKLEPIFESRESEESL